jgi:hypothetical protein
MTIEEGLKLAGFVLSGFTDYNIVMGFPRVYGWMSSASVNDAEAKEVLKQAQNDFEAVLQSATE